jgi:hypothetical protein
MFMVGILSWWYSKGFVRCFKMIKNRLVISADIFSIRLLIVTIFAPFRQISAYEAGESLADKIRVFFDKLLSRIIGAIVRIFMIIFGLIIMTLQIILGVVTIIFWLIIPLLPIAGLILMATGWVPQWI